MEHNKKTIGKMVGKWIEMIRVFVFNENNETILLS